MSQKASSSHLAVTQIIVDEASEGQRIDNFLAKKLKGVPKSHIYRILRSGEVRVNKGRINASRKLDVNDVIRVPPIRLSAAPSKSANTEPIRTRLNTAVLFEDDAMLALNKPAGTAVHGGSGISRGVIEQLRLERPKEKFLELVHRLDRDTSGVLFVAKKRKALLALHKAMRENKTDKRYLILVSGEWQAPKKKVTLMLNKYVLPSGERRVSVVNEAGGELPKGAQHSETVFYLKQAFNGYSLLEAKLITGRTHQLRVQLAHLGHPIVGDDKYGDFALNKKLHKAGLKRMFLHAAETKLHHPISNERLRIAAPLPEMLKHFLSTLDNK